MVFAKNKSVLWDVKASSIKEKWLHFLGDPVEGACFIADDALVAYQTRNCKAVLDLHGSKETQVLHAMKDDEGDRYSALARNHAGLKLVSGYQDGSINLLEIEPMERDRSIEHALSVHKELSRDPNKGCAIL